MKSLKAAGALLAVLTLFLLATGMVPVRVISATNYEAEQINAANYIDNRYDERLGLVSESEDAGTGNSPNKTTPCFRTFWLYSDNERVAWALMPSYPAVASEINDTVRLHVSDPQCGESQLFETLFGVEIPMPVHASRSFIVKRFEIQDSNYDVCADRHWPADGGIFYDAAEYADLCFYISLNCFWQGNITGSESWFRKAEAMWQGHGFFDKNAKRTNNYDNYKLGLYLYTARVTRFSSSIYASVESVAWSYQKREDGEGRGGITTLSSLDGEPFGTANIETTSALLLAYNEDLIARLHAQGMKAGATVALDTAASRLALIASPEDSSAKKYVADAKSRITGAENASEIGDYDSSYLQATEATGLLDKAIAAERAYQSFKFQMLLLVGGLSVAAIAIVAGVVMRKRQQYHHLHHA